MMKDDNRSGDKRLSQTYRRAAGVGAGCGSNCPASTRLSDLSEGRLWSWQRRALLAHLSTCSHCADDYRSLLSAREGLQQALMGVAAPRGHGIGSWLTGAGTAAAAVALLAVVVLSPETQAPPSTPVADNGHGVIFSSDFDAGREPGDSENASDDLLFSSNFGDNGNS
ncbi:MAG: hypothetical protein RQ741_12435 [Wenzhouxiangellaceae bacterium]|nr:hypothetical protein [Wenzhouxiangellaceae bacterium]